MTTPKAIYAAGASLVSYLNKAYEIGGKELTGIETCKAQLLSSNDLAKKDEVIVSPPGLSLYLFRITVNEHARNVRRPNGSNGQDVPLAVDLHYLLTAWGDSAQEEHTLIAWAMRELYMRPVLDASTLSPDPNWDPGDAIQVTPAELSLEDMTRVWDALEPSYRLSVAYIARVVRIDPDRVADRLPVVATRFAYGGSD